MMKNSIPKPPLPHPGWSNVLDATNFRSCCPQNDFKGNQLGEENCLFLNIFTPQVFQISLIYIICSKICYNF